MTSVIHPRREKHGTNDTYLRTMLAHAMRFLRTVGLGVVGFLVLPLACACAAPCSNEVLRSELRSGGLPDCRAYELVTPTYKEGAPPLAGVFAVSKSGNSLIGASFGVYGGALEDQLGNSNLLGAAYLYSRTAVGWKASPLGPAPSMYNSNGMFDASTELNSSLWELSMRSQPSNVTGLYIERQPGHFTEVGPATPNPTLANRNKYNYLGASRDLSRVIFSTESGFHWPSDATVEGASPLYEYVDTGNVEPRLVGVSGGVESTDLVSRCGTRLGSSDAISGEGSMYNAISSDGTRVFFTAVGEDDRACGAAEPPADELFVREEISPNVMQTTAVSEPAEKDCGECLTGGGVKDAVFEGASEDGSKVFFLTEQELLPGATGKNLYEYDFAGQEKHRITLISSGNASPGVLGVTRVSEDGSHIYFVARGVLASNANSAGYTATAGHPNLYVANGEHTSFIATLSQEDEGNDWRQIDNRTASSSHDGQILVFVSQEDITREGITPGINQVFRYDAGNATLVRASIGHEGYNNNGKTPLYGAAVPSFPPSGLSYRRHDSPTSASGVLVPEDGAVFFESPDALTPQALKDELSELGTPVPNVYEYRDGKVYLLSDGQDSGTVEINPSVQLIGWGTSGEDVFLSTSDSMVPQDTDAQQDIYDARVEGGIPVPLALAPCLEDACRGGLTPPPSLSTALAAPMPEAFATPGTGAVKTKLKAKAKHAKPRPKKRRSAGRKRRKAKKTSGTLTGVNGRRS